MEPDYQAETTEEDAGLCCSSGIPHGKRLELYQQALETARQLEDSALVEKCFESLLELDSPAASEEVLGMISYLRDQLVAEGFRFGGERLEGGAKILLCQLALWSDQETLVMKYFADELRRERSFSERKHSALCACDLLNENTEDAFCAFLEELVQCTPAHSRDELMSCLISEGLSGQTLGVQLLSVMPELAEVGLRAERATLALFQQLGHRAALVSEQLVEQALKAEPNRSALCLEYLSGIGADAKPALEEKITELSARATPSPDAHDLSGASQVRLRRSFLDCIGKIFGARYLTRLEGHE